MFVTIFSAINSLAKKQQVEQTIPGDNAPATAYRVFIALQ